MVRSVSPIALLRCLVFLGFAFLGAGPVTAQGPVLVEVVAVAEDDAFRARLESADVWNELVRLGLAECFAPPPTISFGARGRGPEPVRFEVRLEGTLHILEQRSGSERAGACLRSRVAEVRFAPGPAGDGELEFRPVSRSGGVPRGAGSASDAPPLFEILAPVDAESAEARRGVYRHLVSERLSRALWRCFQFGFRAEFAVRGRRVVPEPAPPRGRRRQVRCMVRSLSRLAPVRSGAMDGWRFAVGVGPGFANLIAPRPVVAEGSLREAELRVPAEDPGEQRFVVSVEAIANDLPVQRRVVTEAVQGEASEFRRCLDSGTTLRFRVAVLDVVPMPETATEHREATVCAMRIIEALPPIRRPGLAPVLLSIGFVPERRVGGERAQ